MPIKHPFEYQQPTAAMVEDITKVREACKALAGLMADVVDKLPRAPKPAELSLEDAKADWEAYEAADAKFKEFMASDAHKNNTAAFEYIKRAFGRLEEVSMLLNKAIVFADCEAYRD